MLRKNAKRLDELEQLVSQLTDGQSTSSSTETVTTRSKWVALVVVIAFTAVFGFLMYVAISEGPGKGDPNVIALVGALAVGVSVVVTNVSTLIDEWKRPRQLDFDSWMVIIAFGTGAIGSALVFISVL
ncbi:hypothetical protein [Curtobacterium flaccumfaciens]|uniref:hypothetical protein n=1 Tax=Curtobacterium flaccumfaciens TaxID=2035 RepID=UPI00112C7CAC|nr:hypothetical protein [Curtobacterium flaccumfaciens]